MPKGKLSLLPATIRITVHEPIPVEGYSRETLADLIELTRARVESAL